MAGGGSRFVGRQAELTRLEQVALGWLGGTRSVVFLSGEVGLGKTTLLRAFLARLEARTTHWSLRGQCVEQYGNSEPYLPLVESLARACRGSEGAQITEVLRRAAPTWLWQIPSLLDPAAAALAADSSSAATPPRMKRELADAVEILARERRVVLAFEDLHWADPSTLDLIAYLARCSDPARCLIVSTHRPGEETASADALGRIADSLRGSESFTELALEHLTESAVQDYSSARFGPASADPHLASLIHERTRGNPPFIVQLADTLAEQAQLRAGFIAGSASRRGLGCISGSASSSSAALLGTRQQWRASCSSTSNAGSSRSGQCATCARWARRRCAGAPAAKRRSCFKRACCS